jgi:hypothetical protein
MRALLGFVDQRGRSAGKHPCIHLVRDWISSCNLNTGTASGKAKGRGRILCKIEWTFAQIATLSIG